MAFRNRRAEKGEEQALGLELRTLREELSSVRRKQEEAEDRIKALTRENSALKAKFQELESFIWSSLPPFHFVFHNYTHYKNRGLKWFSPSFHSRPRGYKLAVEVVAGGSRVGEGSHVSVYVHVVKGVFDDNLRWPFRGLITIRLLNERRDGGHHDKTIVFTENTPLVNSGRAVVDGERVQPWGDPLFIPHSDLLRDHIRDTEYMVVALDRLCFAVLEVQEHY